MTKRATVTEHMEKYFEKNDELKVRQARADKLTLALTNDC